MSYFGIPIRNGASVGLGSIVPLLSRSRSAPSLALNFLSGALSPQVTFSRTSNATLFDSAGNLVYAPNNLLTFSEQFDNAAWAKSGSSITANTTVSPDGTTNADSLVEDGGTSGHRIAQTYTGVSISTYTTTFFAKLSGRSWARVLLDDNGGSGADAFFDLSSGVVGTVSALGVGSLVSASITPAGNGWYRCSLTCKPSVVSTGAVRSYISGSTGNTVGTYLGTNGLTSLFLYGAQLNVGALQPYYSTTVPNLLGYTQEFDNAAWTKTQSSVAANTTTAPDGTTTADTLVENGANAAHFMTGGAASFISGTTYTLSVYAKFAGRFLRVLFTASAFPASNRSATFNLQTGEVVAESGVTASAVNVGNGWYRCRISVVAAVSTTGDAGVSLAETFVTGLQNYQGDGVSGAFLWGAQLSDSASLDPYVYNPVAAPSPVAYYGPRFDYSPTTLQPLGLLIEEQRTNSIRNNTMVGAVAGTPGTNPTNWSIGLGGLTQEIVGTGSFNGVSYIDVRLSGTTTGVAASILFETVTGVPWTNTQVFTLSAWWKIVGGSAANITSPSLAVNGYDASSVFLSGAFTAGGQVGSLSTTWQRITRTFTGNNAALAYGRPLISLSFAVGAAIDITLRVGLPQLELGAFVTSVIPTTTAAATRAADVAAIIGDNFSNWYNQSEGTFYAKYSRLANVSGRIITIHNTTANNQIRITGSVSTNIRPDWQIVDGGVVQANVLGTAEIVPGAIGNTAGVYKVNNFQQATNASLGVEDNSGTVPTVTALQLGANEAAGAIINGHIRQIAYYPSRLSNAQLQALTT